MNENIKDIGNQKHTRTRVIGSWMLEYNLQAWNI